MDPRKMVLEDMDWIRLGQNKERWRALVNTVTNFLIP
jgi:hypothetical protein